MSPQPSSPNSAAENLTGVLERVTYRSSDTGYTVARFAANGVVEPVTVVGPLVGAEPGANLRLWGRWAVHPRYGRQFKVDAFYEEPPATTAGIRNYLATGPVRGVGPVTAERIVEHFGLDTLRVLDEEPERLTEVHGVGAGRAQGIAASWSAHAAARKLMVYLQGHGVPAGLAARIYKAYEERALAVVQANPYQLAREVRGIGFRTADSLALKLGKDRNSPERMEAGALFALETLADDGHTAPPWPVLEQLGAELLDVSGDLVSAAVGRLAAKGDVIVEVAESRSGGAAPWQEQPADVLRVGLPIYVRAEAAIAAHLAVLISTPATRAAAFRDADWGRLLAAVDARSPHPLAAEQRLAVQLALTNKVTVLTGGPGTGKTTTVRTILALALEKKLSVELAAPTGRAAKRMYEATGHRARTVHRLLEFSPTEVGLFKRGPDDPIDADIVIVDEASMLDTLLAHSLFGAVHPASLLVLVGDADQLPSVGPGNVLGDLLASGVPASVRLRAIFRQAENSHIALNAHRILAGDMPLFERDSSDFFLFKVDDADAAAQMVVDVAATRVPRRFGLDARRDIQVLSPMHRGPAGVQALNKALQARLNPGAQGQPDIKVGGSTFRVGDRVMQMRNDYRRGVFNGDQGIVIEVDGSTRELVVAFDEIESRYDSAEAEALALAYACSVHKSQGSEYPAVVLALLTNHYMMLQRNLVYTAITRARNLCVIVGSQRAVAMAVANNRVAQRHTALAERLAHASDETRTDSG